DPRPRFQMVCTLGCLRPRYCFGFDLSGPWNGEPSKEIPRNRNCHDIHSIWLLLWTFVAVGSEEAHAVAAGPTTRWTPAVCRREHDQGLALGRPPVDLAESATTHWRGLIAGGVALCDAVRPEGDVGSADGGDAFRGDTCIAPFERLGHDIPAGQQW